MGSALAPALTMATRPDGSRLHPPPWEEAVHELHRLRQRIAPSVLNVTMTADVVETIDRIIRLLEADDGQG